VVTSREPNNYDPSERAPNSPTVERHDLDAFPAGDRMDRQERSQYREFCLQRLADLLSRRGERLGGTARERALQHTLIDRALYTAYRDCVAAGAKAEADRLLSTAAEMS
jgi:hypothetical protein